MKAIRLFYAPCLILLLSSSVLAQVLVVTHWPTPLPRPTPSAPVGLECRRHQVSVSITDQVATTEVDQDFYNPHASQLEGHYFYPLPDGAEIDKFELEIDGTLTQAELLDADKARKIYEDIVRSKRDPALMEYVGRGMLRVRIFPIEPHSTRRVRLAYTQILRNDSGLIGYRAPFKIRTFNAQPVADASVRVNLKSVDVLKTVYSPSR